MKKLILSIAIFSFLVSANAASPVNAAVTGFMPGRIIDDGVMTNKSTMSPGDIQAFLNSKMPTCDTWGTQPYGGTTRAQYAASRGVSTPFTCLKDYVENGKTSAQIIYHVSQKYNINPQVMIVLLQKEQGLITDDWPWPIQYRSATGYGCPDTAPCDAEYYGLTNQVDWAARMFRAILNNSPTWYTPYVLGDNYIQYSPDGSCGGSVVNIQNRSTQALYNYTPYQPNAGALAADWGTAPCGAYGNRNFYLYFSSWFGSPLAPTYAWQVSSQYVYTNDLKQTAIGLDNLNPGSRVFVGVTVTNTGSSTWSNSGPNPVRLGTSRELGRSSPFYDQSWIGYSRPTSLKEASVAPGQTGTFEFWITVPEVYQATNFNEYFTPLSEGRVWMPDMGLRFAINVKPHRYTWDLVSQYAYTDETKSSGTGLYSLEPGQRKYIGLTLLNTGSVTWSNTGPNPLNIGTSRATDRVSSLYDSTWITNTRPSRLKEASVAPGQTGTFEFWIKAPTNKSGNFAEYFTPVIEGRAWLTDIGLNYSGSVINPSYTWELTSQYAYSDSSKATVSNLNSLSPGQLVYVGFTAKNTGNITWYNSGINPVRLGSSPNDRMSIVCDYRWISCNRPTGLKEASVAPGQTGTFEFWIKAPTTSGLYAEYFNLLSEGQAWMKNINLNFSIRVN